MTLAKAVLDARQNWDGRVVALRAFMKAIKDKHPAFFYEVSKVKSAHGIHGKKVVVKIAGIAPEYVNAMEGMLELYLPDGIITKTTESTGMVKIRYVENIMTGGSFLTPPMITASKAIKLFAKFSGCSDISSYKLIIANYL